MIKPGEHTNLSDQELLQKYRSTQDNYWLGILLQRYTLLLYGVSMKYLRNEDDAKDAVQQVFEKVMNELQKYDVQYFKSWLYMIVKNHCLMHLRKQPAHVELKDYSMATDQAHGSKDEHVAKEKQLTELEAALQELNADQRECITLFFLDKQSYQQISDAKGFTIMQVKSHIQNGKRNLKIILDRKQKT